MSASAVLAEGGRLIQHLDKSAYDAVPFGEVLDPVEFIRRHQRDQEMRRRLEDWIKQIPEHLHALRSGLLQAGGLTVFDFPSELRQVVNSVSKPELVPAGIRVMLDAIRRGQTSITHVGHAGLFAFYWPASTTDFADLLSAKEALALLRTQGIHVKERTLTSRASDRPTLKQGPKYLAKELLKAAAEGFFEHGNRRS